MTIRPLLLASANLIVKPTGFAVLLLAGSLALAPALRASPVAVWDFENASLGQVSGIAASSTSADIASASFDTGNNGVEDFGGSVGQLSLTRFLSDYGNRFPSLTFTLNNAVDLTSISFSHYHNHNLFFPTNPSYNFDVQIDAGFGWTNLATGLLASPGTDGTTEIVNGPGLLAAGTYSIRWIGNNFTYGDDSNTEYFGLNDVTLNASAVPENSTSLVLVAFGASVAFLARRRVARG